VLIGPRHAVVVVLRGGDRHRYLHDVTTQRFDDVAVGDARATLVLDPHGSPLAAFHVLIGQDEDRLVVPESARSHVMDVLARRTFLADARFDETDDAILALRGGDVDESLAALGVSPSVGMWVALDGVYVARHEFGAELVGAHDAVDRLAQRLEDLGGSRVDAAAITDAMVAEGEPQMGREIVAPHLPEELGLLPTHVHLAKGCYPGQEAVARMWMLGRPRRRLARVRLVGDVQAGREVGAGRQKVTVTATVAGAPRGLAFVPADAAVGDRFVDGDDEVAIVDFVGGDTVPPGHDPAVIRRRDRKPAAGR
jgi:folate-binding protein YgfZ